MIKVKVSTEWPIENGNYVVGNPYSPTEVVVILSARYDKIPQVTKDLVRAGIEAGAAISGTLQTANIGIEKIIANTVSNPNIRYLIVAGKEAKGHYPGDALLSFMLNGIDENRYIIGTKAPTATLKNLPLEAIQRFREQSTLIDLLDIEDIEVLRKAVTASYQEKPTNPESRFEAKGRTYELCDLGAYEKQPIFCKLTDKLRHITQ